MNVRVITLRYSEALQGFPEEPLRDALAWRSTHEVREHFFVHGGIPHLALVVEQDESQSEPRPRRALAEDPGKDLPEHVRKLYQDLRTWRNNRAKSEGIPSYTIARNVQLAAICRELPGSQAALKTIDGIGEAICAKYGADILGLVAGVAQNKQTAQTDESP